MLLAAGTRFRAIDVKGNQWGDLFVFSQDDVSEFASAGHTRVWARRLFPAMGPDHRPGENVTSHTL